LPLTKNRSGKMAYFANGSEGMILDNQCEECLPFDPCPIYWLQMEYNYEQCREGQEKLKSAMNILINEKGICQMKQYVKPRLEDPDKRHEKKQAKTLLCGQRLEFGNLKQIEALKKLKD
jgi:hypothetical protein